ncbi:MAG TPA: SHOCT domain-containing protein [Solirubrobacterales bacterium]|nr:SHOCT domain-containing protein [Solirubrobacterales bacterium]
MAAERPHRGWVRFLTILVGIVTVIAILSTWVDRQVFDTDEWGDTSLKMLQNPEIQKAVADYAVAELYANVNVDKELKNVLPGDTKDLSGVAAGALRQVADQGAQRALGDQRIQDLWRSANIQTHKTLIAVLEDKSDVLSTDGGQVKLELQPLIVEIASQVGLGEQAKANIPASVGQIEIVNSSELATAQKISSLIHGLALVASLLALILIALAVYLSPGYRWLTVLWIAVTLIITSVIVLILRSVAGGILVPELASPDIQPAAQAAYDIGTDLLKSIAWTVIWASLVLIAGSWLISPNKAAKSTRGFLAVPFGRYPGAVYGVLALFAFIFLITGADDQRGFLVRLMIVILVGTGTYFFRRQLMLENPDADFSGINDFFEKSRDKAKEAWGNRPRDITKNLPKIGGDKSSKAAGEAETKVMAAEADPETVRLDRLERLASMHERGILTDEEFAEEKARLRK